MRKLLLLIFTLTPFIISFGQDNEEVIEEITDAFRNFEYNKVIEISEDHLKDKDKFSNPELIEIYRMKGISHYALLDDNQSRLSFIEILRLDSSYVLDPAHTSPKIISFFSNVKNEYLASIEGKEEKIVVTQLDTVYVTRLYRDTTAESNFKHALIRSLIIPGTGHLYLDSNLKSWVLTILSAASIGAGIYYISDTNEKEKIYLMERNPNETGKKYNDYNFSYRMRNLAFISFAALWLYSQIDLLFFIEKEQPGIFSYLPKVNFNLGEGIILNYHLKF